MDEIFLDAELREELGRAKVKDLRQRGFIPAVVYAEGKESRHIKVAHSQLLHLIHQHRLENVVINLRVKDNSGKKGESCLIKEIQYDPVHGHIRHVDFNEISLTKAVKVKVPVVAKGEPVGVKQEGGSLDHILWEIEVECLPTDIPKEIEADVSALKIGDAIHIRDIALPANIKVLDSPEAIILSVSAPLKEEVAAVAAEGEKTQEPEVIKEKKEAAPEGSEEDKEKKQ